MQSNVANVCYWFKVTKHLHFKCYKLYYRVQIPEAIVNLRILLFVLCIIVSTTIENIVKYYRALLYNIKRYKYYNFFLLRIILAIHYTSSLLVCNTCSTKAIISSQAFV